MKTYFQAAGWTKFYEQDLYEDGCQPNTGGMISGNELFKADTLDGLLNELLAFTSAERSAMKVNACDDDDRIDISVMEDDDGSVATPRQIELWKAGEIRLWDCIYTFQAEKITSDSVFNATMRPRSTEFYSDAYAYAVGYRDGREGNHKELPNIAKFSGHHQALYADGYQQGKRDYQSYDHHDAEPAYNPMEISA